METKTLLGELAKVCESGNLTYAQKICGLYKNFDIRGQDDLLIKTICISKHFHMLDWLLDLGKKMEKPYDLDSLLSELISTMDEETLDRFFECITTYNNKNEVVSVVTTKVNEIKSQEINTENKSDSKQINNKKKVLDELLKLVEIRKNKKLLMTELTNSTIKLKSLINQIDNSDHGKFLLFSSGKQTLKNILCNMDLMRTRNFINYAIFAYYGINDELIKKIVEVFKGYKNGCIKDKNELCEIVDSLMQNIEVNNSNNNCDNLENFNQGYDNDNEVYEDEFKDDQENYENDFEDDDFENYTDSDEDYEQKSDMSDDEYNTLEYDNEEFVCQQIKTNNIARNKYLINSHLQFIDDYLSAYSKGEHGLYIKSILNLQKLNSHNGDTLNGEIVDYLNAYNIYQGRTDADFIRKFNDKEISNVFIDSILSNNYKNYKNIELDQSINMANIRHMKFEHENIRIETIINSTHPSIVVKQKNMPKKTNNYDLLDRNKLQNKLIKSIIEEINDGIRFTARILKRTLFKYELLESHEKYIDEIINVLESYNYDVSVDISCSTMRHNITYIQIEW